MTKLSFSSVVVPGAERLAVQGDRIDVGQVVFRLPGGYDVRSPLAGVFTGTGTGPFAVESDILLQPSFAGWIATRDGFEPGAPIGHGRTECLAVAELLEAEELRADV